MHYLGVDIGGTTIKAGLCDETGRVLESRKTATATGDLKLLISNLADLIRDIQRSHSIKAIGLGIPGLRNSKTHVIETSPNIPCLDQVNLEQVLADQVHIDVVSENDANAGAYGEFVCGAGTGSRNLVYLTIGTGFGSGIVLNGEMFRGSMGYAGELGHTIVQPEGRLCKCGNRGCLETVVSGTGMVASAMEAGRTDWTTPEMIYDAARLGDETARRIFAETAQYLGIACANLINLLNLDSIVIGGGVLGSGNMLLAPAIEEAGRRAFASSFICCQIVQSKLWPESGMIGAAMLARDR